MASQIEFLFDKVKVGFEIDMLHNYNLIPNL